MSVTLTTKEVPIKDIEDEIARRKSLGKGSVLFAAYQGEVYLAVTDTIPTPPTMSLEDNYDDGPDLTLE